MIFCENLTFGNEILNETDIHFLQQPVVKMDVD